MLTHIVVWKYDEEVGADLRREHIERLRKLPDVIPEIIDFEVGPDILGLERSYDTALVASFRDLEALAVYTAHAEHQKVASMGRQISAHVASVDFLT